MLDCIAGVTNNWMPVFLAVGVLVSLWMLWRVQRAVNGVDFKWLILGPDGKPMWSKMAAIAGFMVGSWVMVYVTIAGKVPEGLVLLFLCYFAICIGSPMAFAIINAWKGTPAIPPPTTATLSVPSGQSATVQAGPVSNQ